VAIAVVNHNTRLLIAQLVFSLYRILGRDQFTTVVVVDNASSDGSVELLRALDRAGLVHLIANRRQRYHGSGLNQAISWLASRQAAAPPQERVDYVWTLDSDTLVLRRDVVHDAVARMRESGAAVAGEMLEREGHGPLVMCSLLLEPARVWRPGVAPFSDDGAPERLLLESVTAAGLPLGRFEFLHHTYVLHLGSGTLREIAKGEWGNRFYGWASGHSELTYNQHPLGRRLHASASEAFAREVPVDDPDALVRACRRDELLVIPEAKPLPPRSELLRLYGDGVDLEQYLLSMSS
jgi:glycosyltransferase involved in cell wall biosynthesis